MWRRHTYTQSGLFESRKRLKQGTSQTEVIKLKNKRPTWCHLLFYFTSYVLNMFRTLIYPSSVVSVLQASACYTDTTPTQPHRNSNTHRTNVVIQQNSRKLLMMDVLMSETCWAHKKWNKIASDIKLVFYSSNITMMHGPINIRSQKVYCSSNFPPIKVLNYPSSDKNYVYGNFEWLTLTF